MSIFLSLEPAKILFKTVSSLSAVEKGALASIRNIVILYGKLK